VTDCRIDEINTTNQFVMVLPGVTNTRSEVAGVAQAIQTRWPHARVVIRPWGAPLMPFRNLSSEDDNLSTARGIANELAGYRRGNPSDHITLLGFSDPLRVNINFTTPQGLVDEYADSGGRVVSRQCHFKVHKPHNTHWGSVALTKRKWFKRRALDSNEW
jgi:hypothetical protein